MGFPRIPFAGVLGLSSPGLLGLASPAAGVAGFGNVGEARFFTEAVQWMVDNDITTPSTFSSPTCFSPEDSVTRDQAAATP